MKVMLRAALVRSAVIATLLLACSASARAQAPYYQPPAGPTISPYLDLFRRDQGVLNNYYNYIVPQRRLTQTLSQQSTAIRHLQTEVQGVQGQLQQPQEASIRPTGVGSGFMNYSHYYQFRQTRR